MSLARLGDFKGFMKFLSFSALGGITTHYLMNPRTKLPVNGKNLVVTTGCDSGLGYSMAIYCHENLKMSVVACVHHLNSKGSVKLRDQFANSKRFHIVELELAQNESIANVEKFVRDLLEKNKDLKLTALVNNSGRMCMGETEWQTTEIIDDQINVNFTGTIKFTKAFLPLCRQYKARIINTTSHCASQSLPALPVYSATKAGLAAFTEGLRLDMNKYGVEVINFVPGSFFNTSNISACQKKLADDMRSSFNEEQIKFYGDFFDSYNSYLEVISGEKEPQMVSQNILETFEEALLHDQPKTRYVSEPLRYKIYYTLFKITPQKLSDYLIQKFVMTPSYDPSKSITNL